LVGFWGVPPGLTGVGWSGFDWLGLLGLLGLPGVLGGVVLGSLGALGAGTGVPGSWMSLSDAPGGTSTVTGTIWPLAR
jgi:hypothetical protein